MIFVLITGVIGRPSGCRATIFKIHVDFAIIFEKLPVGSKVG
jgi:hypothetical protein